MKKECVLRWILKAINGILSVFVVIVLFFTGAYAVYALWDNHQIYASVGDVRKDLLRFKPDGDKPSFEELLEINPDVCAWVTVDHTEIDDPILHGETNLTYINTDVYGEFSLAGSIYLDSRNAADFSDAYALLYGHHMENGGMFGDLEQFKKEKFFEKNKTGTLLVPGEKHDLEIFACLVTDALDEQLFDPERWRTDVGGLLDYVEQCAPRIRPEVIDSLRAAEHPHVLALSTCSSEYDDARTIVLAAVNPCGATKQEE